MSSQPFRLLSGTWKSISGTPFHDELNRKGNPGKVIIKDEVTKINWKKGVKEMANVSVDYNKVLPDGTDCKFTFSIEAEKAIDNVEAILHELAQLSKTAYIHLGNKIIHGTANQEEIQNIVAKCNQHLK